MAKNNSGKAKKKETMTSIERGKAQKKETTTNFDGNAQENETMAKKRSDGNAQKCQGFEEPSVNMIKIRFHHKGTFTSDPLPAYLNGEIFEPDGTWDMDEINTLDLAKFVTLIGYPESTKFWYVLPGKGLAGGLRQLGCDKDVHEFVRVHKGIKYADVYLETPDHNQSTPTIRNETPGPLMLICTDGNEENIDTEGDEINKGSEGDEGGDEFSESGYDDYDVGDDFSESGDDAGEEVDVGSDLGSGSEFEDSDFDENWAWTEILPEETVNHVKEGKIVVVDGGSIEDGANIASRNLIPTTIEDFVDEDGDSEDLDTPDEVSEDGSKKKYPKFKLPDGDEPVTFQLGQIFTSADIVRTAVKEYGLKSRKNVYLNKNEKARIVVKCTETCPFYMRVIKSTHKTYFQVVSLDPIHKCHKTGKNRQAKPTLIAKKLISILRHTPTMRIKALQTECKTRWGLMLSRYQVYRAKTKALEMIEGSMVEQYKHLRSYAEELLRSNPGSTVLIKSKLGVDGPVFSRMYVCFNACKIAFARHCRPLIGLDGCFLKGRYGGQLLTAVGKDGNNQMIPIAFAIVEAETKDSWSWFTNLLLEDLNKIQYRKWSFISDQQKGLVDTLKEIDANVEHRLCVKHLYGNFRKRFPGEALKEALWRAARCNTVPEFDKAMESMKRINEEAWEEMSKHPPGMWSRAHYSTHTQCDLQVNNMCEAFNMAILEYRDLPIISIVEGIKFYMTNRIVGLRDFMLRYEGDICPIIQKRLETLKKEADGWTPNWSGDMNYSFFDVSNGVDQYVVNLMEKTCACRRWQLTGIPCVHAICCIWFNEKAPEDYVAHWYRKSTFIATYNNIILPNNGPKLWPTVDALPIQPPYVRRTPGRPKKARRKTNDEPTNCRRLKKVDGTVRCKRCNELGHNRRTCKGKADAERKIPKGGNKTNTCVTHPETQGTNQAAPITQATHVTQSAPVRQATSARQAASVTHVGPSTASMRQAKSQARSQAGTGNQQAASVSQATQQKGARRGRKRKAQSETLGTQQSVNQ